MAIGVATRRWMARAITLAVPVAVIAGPLAGTADAKAARTPAPQLTQKPANPTNDTTGTFAWVSVSGTAYSCGLDGQARSTCAGSFHAPAPLADGLHTLVIRSQATGTRPSNWSYSWRVDTVAPAAPSIAAPPSQTSATSVSVSFSDSDTSVARFTCAVDGQAASACASPYSQSGFAEGAHTLTVTAYDAAGNSASSVTQWTVDRTAPDIPVVVAPASPTNATTASIAFSDSSATSFTCIVDAGAESACTSPLALQSLAEGTHQLTVKAHDAADNVSSYAVKWFVDTTAPAAPAIVTGPAATTDDTSPTVQFTDFDPSGVQFACTVTDTTASAVVQGPEACGSPYIVTGATTDLHSYQLRIVPTDGAGNIGPADSSVVWTLDSTVTPSPASFVAAPPSPSNLTTPTFGFIAPDAGQTGGATGFLCALDGTGYAACGTPDVNAPTTYTVANALADGPHAFSVETVAGTVVSHPVTWSWTVDTTPPAAPQVAAPDPSTVNPTISFGSSEADVSYLCSVDGGPFVSCSSPWTPSGLSSGTHSLVVATMDAAGNQTNASAVSFTVQSSTTGSSSTGSSATGSTPSGSPAVSTSSSGAGDTTPPTVSAFSAPASLTGPAVLTFSETVTGLNTAALRLMPAGTTTGLPVSVGCLTGSSATPCSGGFDAVRLIPGSALLPGQHYTVELAAAAVRDLAGNAVAASSNAFRAIGLVEESSAALRMTWQPVKNRAAFGGSYVREHLAGASASWVFTGRSVTWWTETGRDQGKATVYVDGVRRATVNNYAAATKFRVGRLVKGLTNQRHTLRITVLGVKGAKAATGTFVVVDAFTVGKVRTATPRVATALRSLSSSHFLGAHAVAADLKGETVSLTFRGTGVTWWTMRSVTQGKVAVYVDGALKATYDDFATRPAYHVSRTIGKLADRVHTVQLVVLGTHHKGGRGTVVTVDRFTVA